MDVNKKSKKVQQSTNYLVTDRIGEGICWKSGIMSVKTCTNDILPRPCEKVVYCVACNRLDTPVQSIKYVPCIYCAFKTCEKCYDENVGNSTVVIGGDIEKKGFMCCKCNPNIGREHWAEWVARTLCRMGRKHTRQNGPQER